MSKHAAPLRATEYTASALHTWKGKWWFPLSHRQDRGWQCWLHLRHLPRRHQADAPHWAMVPIQVSACCTSLRWRPVVHYSTFVSTTRAHALQPDAVIPQGRIPVPQVVCLGRCFSGHNICSTQYCSRLVPCALAGAFACSLSGTGWRPRMSAGLHHGLLICRSLHAVWWSLACSPGCAIFQAQFVRVLQAELVQVVLPSPVQGQQLQHGACGRSRLLVHHAVLGARFLQLDLAPVRAADTQQHRLSSTPAKAAMHGVWHLAALCRDINTPWLQASG